MLDCWQSFIPTRVKSNHLWDWLPCRALCSGEKELQGGTETKHEEGAGTAGMTSSTGTVPDHRQGVHAPPRYVKHSSALRSGTLPSLLPPTARLKRRQRWSARYSERVFQDG